MIGPNQVEVRNVGPMYDVSIYLIGIEIEAYVLSGNDSLQNPGPQQARNTRMKPSWERSSLAKAKGVGWKGNELV